MNELDNLQHKLSLLSTVEYYYYIIETKDGEINSQIEKISYHQLFYYLDNGNLIYNIYPLNLSTRFHYWLQNFIFPEIQREIYDGVMNRDWNEQNIRYSFENRIPLIIEYLKSLIRPANKQIQLQKITKNQITTETLKLNKFINNINCKLIYEKSFDLG